MRLAAESILIVLWVRMVVVFGLGIWSCRRPPDSVSPLNRASRVAVIVPAFNEAAVIASTLRSLLAQAPRPREIIVVDDGSTDGTADVARGVLVGVSGARVIRLPRNSGKAAALNAGIVSCGCPLVATIDADTQLKAGALAAALAAMQRHRATAVSFYLDADHDGRLLGTLQEQEYTLSLNFERAAQAMLDAITVLPGAATLFRRRSLLKQPFSGRTCTEDADLTLTLASRGARLVLARDAVATTQVPVTWSELLAQRTRWIAGHLQCSVLHAGNLHGSTWRFRGLVYPNFVLSTWMPPAALAALLMLWSEGPGDLLGLSFGTATAVSMVLVYLLRLAARLMVGHLRSPWWPVLLEPALTSTVGTLCFASALVSILLRIRRPPEKTRARTADH
ncbi:glycosyltransferase family 2 protein [Zoogloea sp. LCSB751]|uniref:glycosyltransferase n=1 Tax=Zoogloea sp. LCSB751 TaxID=1965277 RepID=UPI0009A4D6A3|nr:glycosyltransferase [Zoogloea sp. LCSB751]